MAARERAPWQGWQGGQVACLSLVRAWAFVLPWLPVTALTSQEQLEAGPESLFMSHCVLVVVLSEHAVLGLMVHEICQTLGRCGFFCNLNFLYFFFLFSFGTTILPHHSFLCSLDCSPENRNSV